MKLSSLKRLTLLCALCLPLAHTSATAQNRTDDSFVPGEVWLDTDGQPINAHGGGLLYHEGVYYWYGEYKKGPTVLPEWATWECYRTDVSGVSCYSSTDLRHWKFEGLVLKAEPNDPTSDLHPSKVLERPKVIYNQATRKFVMWAHVESADYSKACAGVAVSDSPTGPFKYLGSFRPNNAMSRDQTVFVDDDGRAYQFYSSENNATLYVSELTADYLRPSGRFTRQFAGESREAPAVFKRGGKYYMLTSGCTGWDPNQARLAVADSIMGQWRLLPGNPCTGPDADKTYYAQSTYVQPVMGKRDTYIALFDRWNKKDLEQSRYVWLPLTFDGPGAEALPTIAWRDRWSLSEFADKPRFEAGNGHFLLNGKPFVVKAAELHYPRIPRPYWEQRIKLVKALGMNAVCLYVFWNAHEPQPDQFDFTGQNDLAEFCRLCQKNGLYVILRPGPYVCAEWEMGGLPWWLLKKKDIRLREPDPYFMERVKRFEQAVAQQVAPLTLANGGPIIMVQVENEYGSYGEDKGYVSQIRDMLRACYGKDVTLFQCDWASNFTKNGLDDLIWTMNFGTGADINQQFAPLKQLRPTSPLMCSEFWSGWFDKWGGNHETRPAADMVQGIDDMLKQGISFSLYMTHGGTNWGHWAGANSPGFAPDVTSYDYDAPISESGQTTPKYFALRETLKKYADGPLPKVPALIKAAKVPRFSFTEVAPLFDNLPAPHTDRNIKPMEDYDQGYGSIIYRTRLPRTTGKAVLTVNEAHDYAQIYLDGRRIGALDRRMGDKALTLPTCPNGAQLDIVVEAMGRVNFGRAIKDYKGITKSVTLTVEMEGRPFVCDLKDWQVYNLHDTYDTYRQMKFEPLKSLTDAQGQRVPGCYRATFNLKKPTDTFLNFESWGKGLVYVNGHAMGRIWEIGPQQTLYMPGCWLKEGENEVLVFDVIGPREAVSEGLARPVLDKLQVARPLTHRTEGQQLDLAGEQPAWSGTLKPGNGWQRITFDQPVTGCYLCIEALNAHDGGELACIAELYANDAEGQRLTREPWTVKYADSEDTNGTNRAADKLFDLQESTYWSTVKGAPWPHAVVIDLGGERTLTGLEYLPRMESGAPGSVKDLKVYVKATPFKY